MRNQGLKKTKPTKKKHQNHFHSFSPFFFHSLGEVEIFQLFLSSPEEKPGTAAKTVGLPWKPGLKALLPRSMIKEKDVFRFFVLCEWMKVVHETETDEDLQSSPRRRPTLKDEPGRMNGR